MNRDLIEVVPIGTERTTWTTMQPGAYVIRDNATRAVVIKERIRVQHVERFGYEDPHYHVGGLDWHHAKYLLDTAVPWPRWYVRLWRWVFRKKPTVPVARAVERAK